jgi:hypothetical protein
MTTISLTNKDKKDIYGYAHITLAGTVKDGEEKGLIEFVKTYNDDDANKRLVVLINIIKAFPDDIKRQVDAICDKNYIKNLPLMCYILKYLFRSESNLKHLMEEMFDEKETLDDGIYLMGCNMLKTVYKNKDMIFSDEIIVNTITV